MQASGILRDLGVIPRFVEICLSEVGGLKPSLPRDSREPPSTCGYVCGQAPFTHSHLNRAVFGQVAVSLGHYPLQYRQPFGRRTFPCGLSSLPDLNGSRRSRCKNLWKKE